MDLAISRLVARGPFQSILMASPPISPKKAALKLPSHLQLTHIKMLFFYYTLADDFRTFTLLFQGHTSLLRSDRLGASNGCNCAKYVMAHIK